MEEFEIIAGILGVKPRSRPKFVKSETPMYLPRENIIYYKDFESLIEECLHCLIHEMLKNTLKENNTSNSIDEYLRRLENIEKRAAFRRIVNSLITFWYLEEVFKIDTGIPTEEVKRYLEKNKEKVLENIHLSELLGLYLKREFHWEPLEMKNLEKVIKKLEEISKESDLISHLFKILS